MCLNCVFAALNRRKTNDRTLKFESSEIQSDNDNVPSNETLSSNNNNSNNSNDDAYSLLPNLLKQKELRDSYIEEVKKARENYCSMKSNYRSLYLGNELSMSKVPDERFFDIHESGTFNDVLKSRGYNIGKRIGKGGYGQVFLGSHGSKEIAIKSIELLSKNNQRKLDRVLQKLFIEIAIMERYPHPNIVTLLDHFIVGKKAFLVMELAPSGSLESFVNKHGPLEERESYEYFIQMLRGLLYLHTFHIAHRDIKLDNVLLWEPLKDSRIRIAKLTDFGLSQAVYQEKEGRLLGGCFAGTRHYMAPEILRLEVFGEFDVSDHLEFNPFKADIYAMGVSLYEMITKTTPFNHGRNLKKMYDAQIKMKYSYPSAIDNVISSQMKDIISKLLEPNADKRLDPFGIWIHPWMLIWYKHHRLHKHPRSPWYKDKYSVSIKAKSLLPRSPTISKIPSSQSSMKTIPSSSTSSKR